MSVEESISQTPQFHEYYCPSRISFWHFLFAGLNCKMSPTGVQSRSEEHETIVQDFRPAVAPQTTAERLCKLNLNKLLKHTIRGKTWQTLIS